MQPAIKETLDKLMKQLEDNPAAWKRSWINGMPHNCVKGNSYRGINVLLLMVEQSLKGYNSAAWATYKQWQDIGAQVRRGEKSQLVVLWKPLVYEKDGEKERRWLLRYYKVFNADQVDGYTPPANRENSEIRTVEEWIVDRELKGKIGPGVRPAYNFVHDKVTMPPIETFKTSDTYYATLLHELVHLTGHHSRCDRNLQPLELNRKAYALEELVAELGAAFMCTHFTVEGDQHASYLDSWLRAFDKQDRLMVLMNAARLATEAFDWLLDRTPTYEPAAEQGQSNEQL